ncbi:MAG: hypothetical protein QOK05_1337 [Chloroflexota bacterium]|nr:hypothetical protein [Chloroflexota bacterium]
MSEQPLDGAEIAAPTLRPGVREDFDLLYRRSYAAILATLTATLGDRAAAEDCTQETFVRAFKAWDRWRPEAPPEAWLHRIAINTANSYRQRQRLGQAGELVRRVGHPRPPRDPGDIVEQNEVIASLALLPTKQAAALVLRHYHGYTNREIALALGVPERTVASRLSRAKERLRAIAGGEQGDGDEVQDRTNWLESSNG